ncbi:DUF6177 family protein [Nocardiopsis changdeensis]|uniref:DUF6177 family protein n=1 Tax=Nocardiopsis changdeensis TaxID=2831969 RepID=UPI003F4770EE
MSYDLVALTAAEPDALLIARILREAVPEGVVRPLAGGGVLEVLDGDGGPLFAVEPAQRVDVAGEAVRLLGRDAVAGLPEGRCWWVELHARPHRAAREAAGRAADALALRLGGNVWTSGPGVERLVRDAQAAGAPGPRHGAAARPAGGGSGEGRGRRAAGGTEAPGAEEDQNVQEAQGGQETRGGQDGDSEQGRSTANRGTEDRITEGPRTPGGPEGRTGGARSVRRHPAVGFEAENAVVVVQDREVVPLTSGISDAFAEHGARGRGLQVLTPSSARITHALRTLLVQPLARWVAADGDGGHFDGISGLPLVWHPVNGFVPRGPSGPHASAGAGVETGALEPAPGFLDPDPMDAHLVVDLVVEHTVPLAPPLGRAAEIVAEHLAGTRPAGWGTHEPALGPWNPEGITRTARHRAPGGVVLHLAGPVGGRGGLGGSHESEDGGDGGDRGGAFAGGIRVSWDGEHARERVSLAFGYPGEPPLESLPGLVEALAGEGLLSTLHVRRGRGRPDLTFAPRWHGALAPVGMAVGPEAVARLGEEALASGPLSGEVLAGPAVWYPVPGSGPGEERYRSMALVAAQVRHLAAAGRG